MGERRAPSADGAEYSTVSLRERPQLLEAAANWFHGRWGIPTAAYREAMEACLRGDKDYDWYLCLREGEIVAGLGVIDNDFHDRPDLSPNLCALYTLEEHRGRGLAGRLLRRAVEELEGRGIAPVYLVTEHTGFYERYGWEYFCPVRCAGEDHLSRLYIYRKSGGGGIP